MTRRHKGVSGLGRAMIWALCLCLLWVVSSLFRGKGLVVAALGAAAFGGAWALGRRFGRKPFFALVFLAVLAAATVLALELILRMAPGALRGQVANEALDGYHNDRDGIYEPDRYLGVVQKPGFARTMHWNGHIWRHETNAGGYRGPYLSHAEAVFLGDSMIYGHGVQADQTVPARFEAASGLLSMNLGQQGSCPVQGLELLRRKGLAVGPRYVLVCAHPTDITDALTVYARDELEAFLRREAYRPSARATYWQPSAFDLWQRHVVLPLRVARVARALVRMGPPRFEPRASAGAERFLPEHAEEALAPLDPDLDPAASLGWMVLGRAIAEIQREAKTIGAQVVLFDLGYPAGFSARVEALAENMGLVYSDAGRAALAMAYSGEEVYLRRDGHWSARGCDAVARRLAESVRLPESTRRPAIADRAR